jgi:phosphopantetheinyl transferase
MEAAATWAADGPDARARLVRGLVPTDDWRLTWDPWGRPRLHTPDGRPPAVSFTRAAGLLFCAAAFVERLGLDAAAADEFTPPYPYDRAFHPSELDLARLWADDAAQAAALAWTAKEAAVKALGSGFHTIDFLDPIIESLTPAALGSRLTVRVGDRLLFAWTRRFRGLWLTLAIDYAP